MARLLQLINNPRKKKYKKNRSFNLLSNPQKKKCLFKNFNIIAKKTKFCESKSSKNKNIRNRKNINC